MYLVTANATTSTRHYKLIIETTKKDKIRKDKHIKGQLVMKSPALDGHLSEFYMCSDVVIVLLFEDTNPPLILQPVIHQYAHLKIKN